MQRELRIFKEGKILISVKSALPWLMPVMQHSDTGFVEVHLWSKLRRPYELPPMKSSSAHYRRVVT